MTVEQLLVPRKKVMINYPDSPYEVGQVLICNLGTSWYDKYPEIFKEVFWWEDRKPEEMPKHVSYISLSRKEKIYGDAKTSDDNFFNARVFVLFGGVEKINSFYGRSVLPATKEEYDRFMLNRTQTDERCDARKAE